MLGQVIFSYKIALTVANIFSYVENDLTASAEVTTVALYFV